MIKRIKRYFRRKREDKEFVDRATEAVKETFEADTQAFRANNQACFQDGILAKEEWPPDYYSLVREEVDKRRKQLTFKILKEVAKEEVSLAFGNIEKAKIKRLLQAHVKNMCKELAEKEDKKLKSLEKDFEAQSIEHKIIMRDRQELSHYKEENLL